MAEVKQVIAIRKDLNMRRGKEIAQGAHAAMSAAKKADTHWQLRWKNTGQTKIVVGVESEEELLNPFREAKEDGLPTYLVTDVGNTEVDPGTHTAFAIGPGRTELIDQYTGDLNLL